MNFIKTDLDGVLIVEPRVFGDRRGFFMETYHAEKFARGGIVAIFIQDNHSLSQQGVLRGLHYQLDHPQGKLVRVIHGRVFDVAVDIRRGSPTFGRWFGITLVGEDNRQLYIPPGFAHGFCVLSESAEFIYKCTDFYHPEDDRGILWNDPQLAIDWPIANPLLSEKDTRQPTLKDAELPVFQG